MSDMPIIAATAWAQAHASLAYDPVEFGHKVALVYCTARATERNAGDEAATAAALAALSVRPEALQAIALLASLSPQPAGGDASIQADLAGAGA